MHELDKSFRFRIGAKVDIVRITRICQKQAFHQSAHAYKSGHTPAIAMPRTVMDSRPQTSERHSGDLNREFGRAPLSVDFSRRHVQQKGECLSGQGSGRPLTQINALG